MLELETMSIQELYDYKEQIYIQLMSESNCINYERLLATLNAISLEMKKRRRDG